MRFVRHDHGDETVLRIEGVLDALTAPEIRPTIEELIGEQRRSIVVDASSLRLIDSSGVGVIVGLFKRCKAYGGGVRVSGLRDQPLAIFKLLRLDRVLIPESPRGV
jgi:anti-sigma B factor antagonist